MSGQYGCGQKLLCLRIVDASRAHIRQERQRRKKVQSKLHDETANVEERLRALHEHLALSGGAFVVLQLHIRLRPRLNQGLPQPSTTSFLRRHVPVRSEVFIPEL